MPAQDKTWIDFTAKYRRELANDVADTVMSKCATTDEAAAFLQHVADRICRQTGQTLPVIASKDSSTPPEEEKQVASIVSGLGQIRNKHGQHPSQLHLPKVSVQDLDRLIVSIGFPRRRLKQLGYDIGRVQYQNVSSDLVQGEPSSSRVGRPSKVNDPEIIKTVGATLHKYTNDSSKVVCVRQKGQKTLVVAKLLSKRLWRIWKAEAGLRGMLSWSSFRKVSRVHFPQLRRPGRKTDVCSHCRTLKRKIAPRAEAEYKKRRRQITDICRDYFQQLDLDARFNELQQARQVDEVVLCARDYIHRRNSNAERDPARNGMSRAVRLSLFEAEARALHKLRGHCDLLEAYLWHRATADRQKLSTAKVLENLSDSEAYFHFDFKENVRYPMSKEETGDEWRAQNKLSLTVFGCTVHTPGRRNTHFLLVSEVLDHDSQMACLLLTYVLEAVQARSAYKWDKVRMLHLVCDCGPHFRSRESYAFFLAEVPKRWNINALWLSIF